MDGNGTPPDELAKRRKRKPEQRARPLTGARSVEARKKQAEAVQLRTAGLSLVAIAERVGYADASGAYRAIQTALAEMLPEETRQEARRLELARLDRLELSAWPRALAGEDTAASTILRCIGMRAKLLGLEAPAIVDVRVREGEAVPVEILDVLNEQTLRALEPLQEEMVRLTELRANAIDVEAT